MSEATARPWRVEKPEHELLFAPPSLGRGALGEIPRIRIWAASAEEVHPSSDAGFFTDIGSFHREEDAALIVKAVNSHDGLVEALANIAGAAAARGADASLPAEARRSFEWIDRRARAALEEAEPLDQEVGDIEVGGENVPMSGLFAASGGDVNVCEFCELPLDDSKPWKRGLDGAGAHEECLSRYVYS